LVPPADRVFGVNPPSVPPESNGNVPVGDGRRDDFGLVYRARGFARRRAGLVLARLRHPRVRFGSRCDVRHGARFLVGRGASVSFGPRCVLEEGFILECRGRFEVGERTVFGHHCTVASDTDISIGRDCLIAEMVSIRDHDHAFASASTPIIEQGRATAPIRIGDNVWIGGKVVTSDLPADCVAVGIPARVLRHRSPGPHSPAPPAR
jgi:acetyltransferase-like isoleucine patch superfamily enzyme